MERQLQPELQKQKEVLDDNARKFTVGTIDPAFLEAQGASAYTLTTDWLETGSDNEKKLAYKEFGDGEVQILLIAKVTKDGSRTSEKQKITKEEYEALLGSSVLHLEKKRHEFDYVRDDVTFNVKYDEFANSPLRVLEIDAATEKERSSFDPDDFPATLSEVTGKADYYGYRVAGVV